MAGYDLPCDSEGSCMVCKVKPDEAETLFCATCAAPWHAACISSPPSDLSSTIGWVCPDCSMSFDPSDAVVPPAPSSGTADGGASGELLAAIRAIQANSSLSEEEKARKRQEVMTKTAKEGDDLEASKNETNEGQDSMETIFQCAFCLQVPERPVTTPCGHNFCLKCFQKWVARGKRTCVKCRGSIPARMVEQPRINSALVAAIRLSRMHTVVVSGTPKVHNYSIHNKDRPDKAFTTERAKRSGKANACSGKIFVTVPPDHFGPVPAENDPERNQGVLVGECWEDRMECRQWGVHLPHVAGIAGQSDYGAQSVALSGGYQDDEDHGEWFLYTGSGGRDLSGNKRTNKDQSFDQKFEKMNDALRVSCKKGYPVRVVRSHKEKRSSYAPESGVRYDGVYRIEKCWRKVGIQGFKVCRYLFVRCDNEPAPWTSDNHGDHPRPLPVIKELKGATDVTERKECPSWEYEEEKGWFWKKPPPPSRKQTAVWSGGDNGSTRKTIHSNGRNRIPPEILCDRCRKVMTLPVTTPCGHSFCKACLQAAFPPIRERSSVSGRSLSAYKIVRQCPTCKQCIDEFFEDPKVNLDLQTMIEAIQKRTKENQVETNGEADKEHEDEESNPNDESGESTGSEVAEVDEVTASVSVDARKRKRKSTGNNHSPMKKIEGEETKGVNQGSPSSPLLVQSDVDLE